MKYTDEQILDSVKNKKTMNKAFKMLMDTYQSRLYHHIRTIVACHQDADDVLQNTFIKIFRNIDKFEGRSSLFTWLFKIATNEAITYIESGNKKHRLVEDLDNHHYIEDVSGKVNLSGDFIRSALEKAINELPNQQKTVFSLRYFEEKSYNDISNILGVSNGALKASYHHAVKKIENYIKQISINEI